MAFSGTIQFGNSAIFYCAIRRSRRQTFSVILDPEEGVIVLVPLDASDKEIGEIVRRKAVWILRHQSLLASLRRRYARRYISGESYLYLGRHYQLLARRLTAERDSPVRLNQGKFIVDVPRNIDAERKSMWISRALQDWYVAKSHNRFPEIVERWVPKVGAVPNQVFIRDQRKRWGSCDSQGNLRLNWRLVMAPVSLIEYVIVHELCHLHIRDHSEDFWSMLKALMPDYESRRDRLRLSGPMFTL